MHSHYTYGLMLSKLLLSAYNTLILGMPLSPLSFFTYQKKKKKKLLFNKSIFITPGVAQSAEDHAL